MTRLLVHVEGETEETFVNELLAPHLVYGHGFSIVSARLIGTARRRDRRGGIRPWSAVRRDIVRHLKEDQASIATTMVDYYAMPKASSEAWPGRAKASPLAFPRKATTIEGALSEDMRQTMGSSFDQRRFIPYVMMHEFEALLFSDCVGFGRAIERPDLAPKFQEIRNSFASPEEIDDSPETAPSKRIVALVPNYQKRIMGTRVVREIGLNAIRAACLHFRSWMERLERLPSHIGKLGANQ